MIPRQPNEFTYTPTDLTPLIAAARKRDWIKVQQLLDSGYSLLWVDSKNRETVIRTLAKDISSSDIIKRLLTIAAEEYGQDSEALKFAAIEATIGGMDHDKRCPIGDIATATKLKTYYRECVPLAEMESKHIDHLLLDEENFIASPDSVFHLKRGNHDDHALNHLQRIKIKSEESGDSPDITRGKIRDGIRSYMSAAAQTQSKSVDWEKLMKSVRDTLKLSSNYDVVCMTIAETLVNGHQEWALAQLENMASNQYPDLDEILGEALISAARNGRTDLIFKLCELAKKAKVDKTKRFIALLSCAAGAALTKEHFALAKIIMQMVPYFQATPADLKEICSWPAAKVERMIRLIKDYKLFTDIALHSGLSSETKLPAWIAAMKAEFSLEAMSDDGFLAIMHHPEILNILFNYRITGEIKNQGRPALSKDLINSIMVNYSDVKLSSADVNHFLTAMNQARSQLKTGNHGNLSFFRLRTLIDEPNSKRQSPEQLKECLLIRQEISEILLQFAKNPLRSSNTKQIVMTLTSVLNNAVSTQMIHKLLMENLGKNHPHLLKDCLKVFTKHHIDISAISPPPNVGK